MLNKLSLHFFQSHETSDLEFSAGVNVITGSSNSGKTSIVRALNLVIHNRPLGDGFIKDDKNAASVLLEFDRQNRTYRIGRARDRKSSNSYELVQIAPVGGDSEIFTGFGNSVPEEISDLLNISDINLQYQLLPYFLVLDSPGQVALYVRKVAKLNEIDGVVSVLSGEIRDCSKKKSSLDEEMKEVSSELEKLSVVDLDRLERTIEEVKSIEKEREETTCSVEDISNILDQLKRIEDNMVHLPGDLEDKISKVDCAFENLWLVSEEFDSMRGLVVSLEELREKKVDLPEDVKDRISSVEILVEKYNASEEELFVLLELIENLRDYEEQYDEIVKEECHLEKRRKSILGQLEECPYCGQKLSKEAKQILIGE